MCTGTTSPLHHSIGWMVTRYDELTFGNIELEEVHSHQRSNILSAFLQLLYGLSAFIPTKTEGAECRLQRGESRRYVLGAIVVSGLDTI